jgi:hypothetical protein
VLSIQKPLSASDNCFVHCASSRLLTKYCALLYCATTALLSQSIDLSDSCTEYTANHSRASLGTVCTAEAIKAAGLSLNDVKPTATAVAASSSPLNITASRNSSSSSNSSNRNGGSSSSAAAAAAAAAAARPQKGSNAVQRDVVQPVSIDLSDENSGAATAATANGYCDSNDVHTKRQRVLIISSSSNSAFPSRSSFLQQQQQQQQQQFESSARVPGLWNRSSTTTSAHRAGQALPNTDSWQVLLLLSTTLSLNCMCLCC